MSRNRSFPTRVTGWRKIDVALEANAADLPELEAHRTRFASTMEQIGDLSAQQRVLQASKQDVSKKLDTAMRQASSLADVLVTAIRQRYGTRSEKLVEFGLQPFRGRKAAKATEKPAPEPTPTPDTIN